MAAPNPAGTDQPARAERPAWLPESLWDADKAEAKQTDIESLVEAKRQSDERTAQVPESADKYDVKLPDDFKLPDGVTLPEGQKVEIDPNDPRIAPLREWAKKNGLPQSEFQGLLAQGVAADAARVFADNAQMEAAATKEREKLGGRATERTQAIGTWLDSVAGEDAAALKQTIWTAGAVRGFEKIMGLLKGNVPGTPGAERNGAPEAGKIDGFEKMSFRERWLAAEKQNAGK